MTADADKDNAGRGHSTATCYRIEVRRTHITITGPQELLPGFIVGSEWRQLPITLRQGGTGIPTSWLPTRAKEDGLCGFAQAMALAHWALALDDIGIEVRLVKYKFEETWSCTEIGVGPPMESFETMRAAKWEPRDGPKDTTL